VKDWEGTLFNKGDMEGIENAIGCQVPKVIGFGIRRIPDEFAGN
jgi:hypothetical protein